MERNNNIKILSMVALFVAVLGVSIGFASFSNNLTISSTATVTTDSTKFDVNFSSLDTEEKDGIVVGIPSDAEIEVENAIINNANEPKITGLKAGFTTPGQSVTYTFFAHNAGEFIAYLNSITFSNVEGKNSFKVCTAEEGTSQALVDSACGDISISLKVNGETYNGSEPTISSHSLAIDNYEKIEVTISYNATENNILADGDFNVEFGNIVLIYNSID